MEDAVEREDGLLPSRAEIAGQIRFVRASKPGDWRAIETLVRGFARALKAAGTHPERAVVEVKALIAEATGDPAHSLAPAAITWALSEYYDK